MHRHRGAAVEHVRTVADLGNLDRITSELAGDMQFQDIAEQALQSVTGGLERVHTDLDQVAEYLDGRATLDDLAAEGEAMESIREGYVMQRQRAVHQDHLRESLLSEERSARGPVFDGATGGEPAIELF